MAWPDGFGINLVASIGTNVGVGVHSRALAAALERHGVPFAIAGVGHDWGGEVAIGELQERVVKDLGELRHPVNVYSVPLVGFETLFTQTPKLLAPGRMHVAAIWWEASALPPSWVDNLSRLDAVLAASGFVANIAANQLALVPVIEAPMPLSLPAGVRPDRARFGLPEGATVFASSFDPNSDPARKNPVAQVQAFRMAFPPEVQDVRLTIRMNNADTELGRRVIAALQAASGGDTRVSIILGSLSYQEVLSFYASSDVHVSLHRGEGLGLPIMESMALGVPAIATAWSGNTSFMDHSNGCPVRYRHARVVGHWRFLQPDFLGARAFWAEPMVDDAAAWMRLLHEDRALRLRLGAAARESIAAYQERAWSRRWIDEIAALWEARAFLPAVPGKFSG